MDTQKKKQKFQSHDFNIFITALIVAFLVLLAPLVAIIRKILLSMFDFELSESYAIFLALTFIVGSLYWFWEALDLSPLPIKGREKDWRRGHGYIAVGNALVVIPIVIVSLIVLISGNSDNGLYLWLAMPGWGVALICWAVGGSSISKSSRWELPKR
ncbi:MAG: hypothetical protein PHP57_10420 [Sideroxydans sp.]|nr:hypothetical protein [Sideroxydans sp.]